MTRPAHLSPALIAVVAAGGSVGTATRYAMTTATGQPGGWPLATFTENVVGAFLLGALLETLLRRGDETRGLRLVRLGFGTGLLGGLTTFSSLAIEIERLLADGALGTAFTYGVATLAVGLTAAFLGVVVAARHHRWRRERLMTDPSEAHPSEAGTGQADPGQADPGHGPAEPTGTRLDRTGGDAR